MPPDSYDEKQQQALRDLEALGRERDLLHGLWRGWFASLLARGGRHLSAADADPSDRIEVIGRRIGRGLAAFAFLAFCLYLYWNYVHIPGIR